MTLLQESELPEGFTYPRALTRLVERQLTRLEPWWIFDASVARERMKGFTQRYPGKHLVPFAKREDNDDVACFDHESPGSVIVVHDFASDAWDRRRVFDDFYAWLRQAVNDMIEFDRLEDD
jgi:hypothetical protein